MRTKTSAVVAFASLLTIGGSAFAANDAHEAYQRAFYGDGGVSLAQYENTGAMGKAAYGTATPSASPKGGTMVLTENGLAQWKETASESAMGRPAFGAGGSGIETAHNGYHQAFYGD